MKLTVLIFVTIICAVYGDECITPNNEKAECISLYSCPALLKGLGTTQEERLEFVRKSNCGGTAVNPLVCCGTASNFTDECITPNNENAKCISLYSCLVLLKGLGTTQEERLEFVRKSNCGGTSVNPLVCCGTVSNFIKTDNSTPGEDLLSSTKICGLQHSDDYFHDESQTVITDYPWLAHIEHDRGDDEKRFMCSGSLINNRYILTAAHCLKGFGANPVGVRLGDYSVQNKTDCSDYFGETECSHPVEDYQIDSITVHPHYSLRQRRNDIGLIRLNKVVTFSDYIRPICLPSSATNPPKIGDLVSSTGWGMVGDQSETADIKKKIQNTIISKEQCQSHLDSHTDIRLTEKHFCMIEVNSSSYVNCQGDSGSPVIYKRRAQWYQEGVVSFGLGCGSNQPTVLEGVRGHLEWIVNNLKP